MTHSEVEALRLQLVDLRERVTRLETYVKVVGFIVAVVPTALQVWVLLRR